MTVKIILLNKMSLIFLGGAAIVTVILGAASYYMKPSLTIEGFENELVLISSNVNPPLQEFCGYPTETYIIPEVS